jgi:low temperature requirement protein LtrA
VFSISVAIFCNILFGLAAVYFSILSDRSYGELDIDAAREHGRMAFKLNMTGIVITIGVIIIAVSLHFLVFTKAIEEMSRNRG